MTDFVTIRAEDKDLDTICRLFEEAILFQKANNYIGWNNYDREYLQSDIKNGLLYKIVNCEDIICVFSICYKDDLIWRAMERGNAVYLHRIVLNRRFQGVKIFNKVLEWALKHAGEKQLEYIRMDTWALNEKIINYYKSFGFQFIENYTTPDTGNLPIQHRNLNVALLEVNVRQATFQTGLPDVKNTEVNSTTPDKVNIYEQFSTINKYWTQKIIGEANGQLIKLAKGIGEVNWHRHDDQDELFILYNGQLTIQLRDKNIELCKGDMFIVPKGMEHCPRAHGEVEFLIMGINITSNAAGGRPENRNLDIVYS